MITLFDKVKLASALPGSESDRAHQDGAVGQSVVISLRQIGHVRCSFSQPSIQSVWKQCMLRRTIEDLRNSAFLRVQKYTL